MTGFFSFTIEELCPSKNLLKNLVVLAVVTAAAAAVAHGGESKVCVAYRTVTNHFYMTCTSYTLTLATFLIAVASTSSSMCSMRMKLQKLLTQANVRSTRIIPSCQ